MGVSVELQKIVKATGGLRLNRGGPGVQAQEVLPEQVAVRLTDKEVVLEHQVYANRTYTREHLLEVLRRATGKSEVAHEQTPEGHRVRVTEKIPWNGNALLEEHARKAIKLAKEIEKLKRELEQKKGSPKESLVLDLIEKNNKHYARAIRELKDRLL